jgi:apolipoprotein N-acyltransferase
MQGGGFRRGFDLAVAVCLLGAQLVYGFFCLRAPMAEAVTLRVALVQQNVPQMDRWTASEERIVEIYRRYAELTELYAGDRNGSGSAVDLVVWPESALLLPWYHKDHVPFLNQLMGKGDFALLTGVDVDDPMVSVYNSVALIQGDAAEAELHHKVHLVPFGEYVPGRHLIPGMDAMFSAILPGDIARGTSTEPLRLEQPDVDLIPLICFEDTVGRVARRFIRPARPQVLVNATNDAWFIDSIENEVHLNNALFRSVELRRPLIRAANTGVSAIIDDRGVVQARLVDPETRSPFIQGVLPGEVQLAKQPPTTLYARFGDAFAVLCAVLCSTVWFITRARTRRVPPSASSD